ncbi:MAG: SGNH/GDSL hydrolase family protein [Hyphomonas sp.]
MTTSRPRLSGKWRTLAPIAASAAFLLSACQSVPLTPEPPTQTHTERWVATWASSPSISIAGDSAPPGMRSPQLEGTVRYVMRVSAGGERVRIVLDGGSSISRLSIGAATIALASGDGIDVRTLRSLTFSGHPDVLSVSASAPVWSDPADLSVPDGGVVVVSLYLREPVRAAPADKQMVVEMAKGANQTHEPVLAGAERFVARPLVTTVHADNPGVSRVIVALGDSITDGTGSTDPLMRGWPDYLAARMHAEGMTHVAIANHGIGGNRLLQDSVGRSALARFDRDVLAMPGVTDVIIMAGINDLGLSGLSLPWMTEPFPVLGAKEITAAYSQLIARARAHGIRAIGATLTPDLGTPFPGYATEEKEVIRNEINDWIRNSGAFDAVIDFDMAVRDPENPQYLSEKYDVGDRLHPSDAGYKAMAEAVDLDLFR